MSSAEELYQKGTRLLESDPRKAIELLTSSLEVAPNAPACLYNRAVAYSRVGRDADAVNDIARLEEIAPAMGRKLRSEMLLAAAPYSDLGNREIEQGNFEEAISQYNSALAYDPSFGDAWVGKGIALHALGKLHDAMACYNKAAEVEPGNYYAYINRAELHLEEQHFHDALTDFSKATELAPHESAPYVGRADTYTALQMPEMAARDRQKVEELDQRAGSSGELQ